MIVVMRARDLKPGMEVVNGKSRELVMAVAQHHEVKAFDDATGNVARAIEVTWPDMLVSYFHPNQRLRVSR